MHLKAVRLILAVAVSMSALVLAACVSWPPGWQTAGVRRAAGNTEALLQRARSLEGTADDARKVADLIAAYRAVVAADPGCYEALWKIGQYEILMGAAYATAPRVKASHYREAVQFCERAMYGNADFRKAVDQGAPVWQACAALTTNEVDAMGYWYTARFYYFKECLSPLGRLLNTRIVIQNDPVMKRIDALDPTWAGGGNFFSRALFCIAAPARFGGGRVKADAFFAKAIEVGPDHLVNRWGRARYLYALTGNTAGYVADLQWVVAQDPRRPGNPYPWNVYFQKTAAEMLADVPGAGSRPADPR